MEKRALVEFQLQRAFWRGAKSNRENTSGLTRCVAMKEALAKSSSNRSRMHRGSLDDMTNSRTAEMVMRRNRNGRGEMMPGKTFRGSGGRGGGGGGGKGGGMGGGKGGGKGVNPGGRLMSFAPVPGKGGGGRRR